MLNLVICPDPRPLRRFVLETLKEKTEMQIGNQVWIVPEQYSFETERRLCDVCGNSVSRFCEVLSLSRLAGRVESIYGGSGRQWLDAGGRFLAASCAAEQVASRLKLYASKYRKPEFLTMLLGAVDEFESYCISPKMLKSAADRNTGLLSQKLEELSILYESYLSVTAGISDPTLQLRDLKDRLLDTDYAADRDFYLCGFSDFTLLEQEILENLTCTARSVTLCLPQAGEHFRSASELIGRLLRLCKAHEIPVNRRELPFESSLPEDLLAFQKSLFSEKTVLWQGAAEHIRVCTCPDLRGECRSAAGEIAALLKAGARQRDIAIACSDPSAYFPVLEETFSLADLDVHISQKRSLDRSYGGRILLSGLRAAALGMDSEAMGSYLKCSGSELTPEQADRLELYTEVWNVHGTQWEREWTMIPAGLPPVKAEKYAENLKRLNHWRRIGVEPVSRFKAALFAAKNVGDQCRAAADFAEQCRLREKLQALSDYLYEKGEYERASETAQEYDILYDALEQMNLVLGNCVRKPEEFLRLTERLLSQYSFSTIPAAVDQIHIGDIGAFRGRTVKHLFVLGTENGAFLSCATPMGLLTEPERKTLLTEGVCLAPPLEDTILREMDAICLALCAPVQSCRISCVGEDPSFLTRRIAQQFGGLQAASGETVLLNPGEAASAALRFGREPPETAKERYLEFRRKSTSDFGTVGQDHVLELYGKEIALSASKTDTFAQCRFRFFMNYGLRADPLRKIRMDAALFGTFVHQILEDTFREARDRGGVKALSDEQLSAIAEKHMDSYYEANLKMLREADSGFLHLFERNRREAVAVVLNVARELRVSDFEPAAFELGFGPKASLPAIRVQGANAVGLVTGFVDRVDQYKDGDRLYVRVVDYKTGSKDFDYASVSVGEGMQMLIYLFALRDGGEAYFGKKPDPCGVLYMQAQEPVLSMKARSSAEELEKERQKIIKRKGLLLDDLHLIDAMEHFEEKPIYLPLKFSKGELTGELADGKQMALLERHVFRKLEEITDGIFSGEVQPNPLDRGKDHSPCRYCDFRTVCQRDRNASGVRKLRKIDRKTFFMELSEREAEAWKERI